LRGVVAEATSSRETGEGVIVGVKLFVKLRNSKKKKKQILVIEAYSSVELAH
jgi:hypothetical protein